MTPERRGSKGSYLGGPGDIAMLAALAVCLGFSPQGASGQATGQKSCSPEVRCACTASGPADFFFRGGGEYGALIMALRR